MGVAEDSARIPRLTEGTDIRRLPIDPFEGFMISRMDGLLSAQEVADSTGADVGQVTALVDKLSELGAAVWVAGRDRPPPVSERPKMSSRRSTAPPNHGARVHTRPPPPGTSRVLYDPTELEEDVELPLERKREILDRYYRLDELNYYELLNLPRSAEKKDIRDGYFALSKVFHPDTLFGKKLGTYKHKMEMVFGALTKAYEVLGKKRKRADYDFYLGLTDTTKAAEQGLAEAEVDAEALESETLATAAAAVVIPSPPELDEGDAQNPPPSSAPSSSASSSSAPSSSAPSSSAPSSSAPSSSAPSSSSSSSPPSRSARERKNRARERLKHRFQRTLDSKAPEPAAPAEKTREDLLRGLAGSLRSAARITGGVDKAAAHVRVGKEAEERGDLLSATNAYRLALSLNDNQTTRAHHHRVKTLLAADLAEKYHKQAKYEEDNKKWGAAALSWKKVSDGRPNSAEPLCRAANAILKAGGDLKHARDLAQNAVDLMPNNKACRVTLARVYMGAGMRKSAFGELQEAAKLDPSDEIVKNLIRDLE